MSRRRRVSKFFERAILGSVMSVVAFVIERRVLKAIKTKGEEPTHHVPRSGEVAPTPHPQAPRS